jgi:hypothetical protein
MSQGGIEVGGGGGILRWISALTGDEISNIPATTHNIGRRFFT